MFDEPADQASQFTDLERQLAAAPLVPPQLDRDALMYRAGYAAALQQRTRRRALPLVFSALGGAGATAIAVTLLVMLVSMPQVEHAPRSIADVAQHTSIERQDVAAAPSDSSTEPDAFADTDVNATGERVQVQTLDELINVELMRRWGRVAVTDYGPSSGEAVPAGAAPSVRSLSAAAGLVTRRSEQEQRGWLQFLDAS